MNNLLQNKLNQNGFILLITSKHHSTFRIYRKSQNNYMNSNNVEENPNFLSITHLQIESNRRKKEFYLKKKGLTMLGELGTTLHSGNRRDVRGSWVGRREDDTI